MMHREKSEMPAKCHQIEVPIGTWAKCHPTQFGNLSQRTKVVQMITVGIRTTEEKDY
jgi:ribosomal protein L34E